MQSAPTVLRSRGESRECTCEGVSTDHPSQVPPSSAGEVSTSAGAGSARLAADSAADSPPATTAAIPSFTSTLRGRIDGLASREDAVALLQEIDEQHRRTAAMAAPAALQAMKDEKLAALINHREEVQAIIGLLLD